ncbi:MAG TPA: hypothetical protein EYP87_05435 [Flavobacteriaceae bacterium]|nr:hypothetical protein [Flavobacteriaceae bacterium]
MKKYILLLLSFLFVSTFIFAQTTAGDYKVDNLDSNTEFSDFGTAFYGDSKIIFSSSRNEGLLKSKWDGNKQPYLDLFEGVVGSDGKIADVKEFSNNLNTKFHEAAISFTPDQKTVYFTRDNYFTNKLGKDDKGVTNLAIYKASVSPDGRWTDIIPMPFNNETYSVGHPAVNKDGSKLYFISDMPGTLGATDLFVVDINEDGTYGIPKNLGTKINTKGKEMFPFIDQEDILYFSSDSRKEGLGGLDVYASKMFENTVSDILHLGKPVNSEADDFAYILKNGDEKNEGYFSSNRSGGKGDDDVYHFVSSPPLKIECNQTVTGIVVDKITKKPINESVVVIFDDKDNEVETATTNEEGAFTFTVDCEKSFKVVASKDKFESDNKTFTTDDNPDGKEELLLFLNPIPEPEVVEVRERVVVNIGPIFFDFDKANIRSDAAIELDKVVNIMNKYPELLIEGGSHTDSRGPDSYNIILSTKRAKATTAYIISKGIDKSRISAKGYGETQLVNHCNGSTKCTEDEHQQNRRTEFVILNPDVLGYITKE